MQLTITIDLEKLTYAQVRAMLKDGIGFADDSRTKRAPATDDKGTLHSKDGELVGQWTVTGVRRSASMFQRTTPAPVIDAPHTFQPGQHMRSCVRCGDRPEAKQHQMPTCVVCGRKPSIAPFSTCNGCTTDSDRETARNMQTAGVVLAFDPGAPERMICECGRWEDECRTADGYKRHANR